MEELLRRLGVVINAAADGEGAAGDPPPPKKEEPPPPAGGEGEDDEGEDDDDPPIPQQKMIPEKTFNRRLAKEVAKTSRLESEIERLKAENAKKPAASTEPPPPASGKTQAEIDAEIDKRADEKATQKAREADFTRRSNEVYAKGTELYPKDFIDTVKNFTQVGGLTALEMEHGFVSAIYDTDNPAKVLYELGKDVEKVEDLLAMSPFRRAIEMNKIAAARPKKQSEAPPPPDTGAGGGGRGAAHPEGLTDALDTKTWMERRNKQVAGTGRRRLGGGVASG